MDLATRLKELRATFGSAIIYSPELRFADVDKAVRQAFARLPIEVVEERANFSAADFAAIEKKVGQGEGCLLIKTEREPAGELLRGIVRLQEAKDLGQSKTSVIVLSHVATSSQLTDRLTAKFGLIWGL